MNKLVKLRRCVNRPGVNGVPGLTGYSVYTGYSGNSDKAVGHWKSGCVTEGRTNPLTGPRGVGAHARDAYESKKLPLTEYELDT